MVKTVFFELKKTLSQIGVYILIGLLAILLVATAFLYSPTKRVNSTNSLTGTDVKEMYDNFHNQGIKKEYDKVLEDISLEASTYVVNTPEYKSFNNASYFEDLFNVFDQYCMNYHNSVNAAADEYAFMLNAVNASFDDLQSGLDIALSYTKDATGYYVLITQENYEKLYQILAKVEENFYYPSSHLEASANYNNNYRSELKSALNTLIYPNVSNIAKRYALNGGYYNVTMLRLNELNAKIEQEYQKVISTPSLNTDKDIINNINDLFNQYVGTIDVFKGSYNSAMAVEALSLIDSAMTRQTLVGYSNISLYAQQEKAVEYQYHIEHNTLPQQFATNFSMSHTSNYEANAYDYTYFVLSIFAVIVIIFAIYLSARTISGEVKDGTMRLSAMRPISRGSLFIGKYVAIMIITNVMLGLAFISSFLVGICLYGTESANILLILNRAFAISAHPSLVIGLFMFSQSLILGLYSAFAMMLSAFVKSDLFVTIIGIVFYIINLFLPIFFGANSWLKFYPFVNINVFAYLGAHPATNSILSALSNNTVYYGMNLIFTFVYVIGISAIMTLIGQILFRRKEL